MKYDLNLVKYSLFAIFFSKYGDTTHTFVERKDYKGLFLPGYKPPIGKVDNLIQNL